MRKIVIVGTLHAGLTSKKELKSIFEKYSPDQILVEIVEEDINDTNFDNYPEEMVFTYHYSKKRGIKVNGFDSKINSLKEGVSEKNNQRAIEEQREIMKNFTWKEMNKAKNLKRLDTESSKKLVDLGKEKERESEMLENINNVIIREGVVLILTGCAHLNFFEKNIKKAIFPFK